MIDNSILRSVAFKGTYNRVSNRTHKQQWDDVTQRSSNWPKRQHRQWIRSAARRQCRCSHRTCRWAWRARQGPPWWPSCSTSAAPARRTQVSPQHSWLCPVVLQWLDGRTKPRQASPQPAAAFKVGLPKKCTSMLSAFLWNESYQNMVEEGLNMLKLSCKCDGWMRWSSLHMSLRKEAAMSNLGGR